MGYKLIITEFDVNDRMAPGPIAQRDRMVADYARAYLDVMLSYPQLGDILAWGMVDRYSWLEGFDPRADKRPSAARLTTASSGPSCCARRLPRPWREHRAMRSLVAALGC